MTALVSGTQADLVAFSTAIDLRLGLPKAGADIGGGRHAPPALSITLRYGSVDKHPTLSQWRYPEDAVVQGERGRGLPLPASTTAQAIDESEWGLRGP